MALTWTWLALLVAVVAAVLAAVAGPLYRHDLITLKDAFYLVQYGAWTGIAGALAGLIGAVATLITQRYRTLVVALIAIALGLAAFIWPYLINQAAHRAPPIHTISTNTDKPPQFVALADLRRKTSNGLVYGGNPGGTMAKAELAALEAFFDRPAGRSNPNRKTAVKACQSWGPDCLAAVQHAWYPDIRPLKAPRTAPDKAYAAALAGARAMGWDIVAADAANRHIEATATTAWFGFQDDIAIDVGAAQNGGSIIDIRSESRIGLSDLGANARRVLAYLKNLRQRLPDSHP